MRTNNLPLRCVYNRRNDLVCLTNQKLSVNVEYFLLQRGVVKTSSWSSTIATNTTAIPPFENFSLNSWNFINISNRKS